ncbi:hypothetical protein [Bradymonas sediminis]|uniref:Uncharacterized protein n=1 Tax=Bradymonas sediminis TaxID=1548548 RepID=A0A2Z4FJ63_9DELT|nr:hypothetical protein [Bradymonas sediminis]AWV89057.1 hypothetical protein DN745_06795 [Bradymonas sediminis]TDP64481.1 hypothetical protein DFR33_109142 [Bradymonas sediminis]
MNQSLHEPGTHFANLLEHLKAFDAGRRRHLATLYGADSSDVMDIAMRWCSAPDAFCEVLQAELGSPDAWWVVEQLVQEHDLEVDLGWLDGEGRAVLCELGVLRPRRGRRKNDALDTIPGALGAILAPHIAGTRPTLPILLGRSEPSAVLALARTYDIPTKGSLIELILRISDTFAHPDFVAGILERLDNPEWIGAAMMALELGGICYWREVFGYEDDEETRQDNIVPLMRNHERAEQREVAAILLGLGVLFKLEEEEVEYTLVGVPEELWRGLWAMGQGWLIEWTRVTTEQLAEFAVRRLREAPVWSTQAAMKWLAVEVARGKTTRSDLFSDGLIASFERRAPALDADWTVLFQRAADLGIVALDLSSKSKNDKPEDIVLATTELASEMLDLPRNHFARRMLADWVDGINGTGIDAKLAQAVGLDEEWRTHLVELLVRSQLPIMPWMYYEGLEHIETGAGCLREVEPGDHELVMLEANMTNTSIRTTKMAWLDVLSTLESGSWYSLEDLSDLLHFAASTSLFSLLEHMIENPHSNYYFPLQRPSFLTFPTHSDAFVAWCKDIIEKLLIPAGLAQVDPADGRVRLDTANMLIPTPSDWPHGVRSQYMAAVLEDMDQDFEIPEIEVAPLRPVPEAVGEDCVSAALSFSELLAACEGREILEFDGKILRLAPL